MAEPASAAVIFSIAKAWSILAGVCGSIVPVLAVSDEHKTSFKNAVFMAVTGSSFAIFVGPEVADRLHLATVEAKVALSWALGVVGVYLVRSVLHWFERRSEQMIDDLLHKVTGSSAPPPKTEVNIVFSKDENVSSVTTKKEEKSETKIGESK